MDGSLKQDIQSVISNEEVIVIQQEPQNEDLQQIDFYQNIQEHQIQELLSSNVIQSLQILQSCWNKLCQRNLIESLDRIKKRQCLVLKCQIFSKTLEHFLKRKTKKLERDACQAIKQYYQVKQSLVQSLYGGQNTIKQSVETSLGIQSVMCSLKYQRPIKILCQNCQKQVILQSKVAKSFILQESSQQQNISYELKNPNMIESGVFISQQKIPNKISNLLPDQLFILVNDQSASFLNIQTLSLPLTRQNSLASKTLSLNCTKQFDQMTNPILYNTQPLQSVSYFSIHPPTPQSILPQQQIPQIQKSFIQKLLIQQSQHPHNNTLPIAKPYSSLFDIPRIQQSQIIYNTQDGKDQFMQSFDMNKKNQIINARVVTQPIKLAKFNSRFSDSEIKKTISQYRSRSTRPPQRCQYVPKKQKQQFVGGPRGHKPTFFQTAFYFN